MISRTVIQVEGLGLRYPAGQPARHTALSNLIDDVLRAPVRLLGVSSNHNAGARAHSAGARPSADTNGNKNTNCRSPDIWALKDEGEVVGLIGRKIVGSIRNEG